VQFNPLYNQVQIMPFSATIPQDSTAPTPKTTEHNLQAVNGYPVGFMVSS
jgi:hypothetical protein